MKFYAVGTRLWSGDRTPIMSELQYPDIVVLREAACGLPSKEYVEKLRSRLPDATIRHARTPNEERELAKRATVITGETIDRALLSETKNLRLFACAAAGYTHLPLETLSEKGVAVTNASGIHLPGLAEQVIGNILVFTRRLHEGWRRQQNREWRHYQAYELAGSTVTIVGLGPLGEAITKRLGCFDVKTIGVRYTPSKGGPTDEVIGFETDPFHTALSKTDYLVISCPLSDTTRGLIAEAELETLPLEAVLVNVARGPIVDTDALVKYIRSERLRGAALDVTDPEPLPADHPLWNFENVLITPHMGGNNPHHWDRLADILARNIEKITETGKFDDLDNQVL